MERFFVNAFCAPTRASLLTGRHSLRTGVWGVTHNKEAMRPDEVTLAEALRAAGYATACIGKWHNGEQFPYTPPGQGFDESFGFHNGHINDYFDAELLRAPESCVESPLRVAARPTGVARGLAAADRSGVAPRGGTVQERGRGSPSV
jgi:arylsulfatase A-like enzyme